jgi:hypothetical protein
MSRLMDGVLARHALIDYDGWGESSVDPDEYWDAPSNLAFEGAALVRLNHPYVTTTGRVVLAPRELKQEPRLRDLVRLRKAVASLRKRALDTAATLQVEEE